MIVLLLHWLSFDIYHNYTTFEAPLFWLLLQYISLRDSFIILLSVSNIFNQTRGSNTKESKLIWLISKLFCSQYVTFIKITVHRARTQMEIVYLLECKQSQPSFLPPLQCVVSFGLC